MNAGTVVFLITVLVVIAAVGVLVARRPRRGVELEPPRETPRTPTAVVEAPPPEVDDATVAEIEDALAEAPPAVAPPEPEVVAPPVKPSFRDRLAKARSAFTNAVGSVL